MGDRVHAYPPALRGSGSGVVPADRSSVQSARRLYRSVRRSGHGPFVARCVAVAWLVERKGSR